MKSGFFIMKLYQTGNVGSHNTEKIEGQPKNGYKTNKAAKEAMPELRKKGNWDLKEGELFAITELFWWP